MAAPMMEPARAMEHAVQIFMENAPAEQKSLANAISKALIDREVLLVTFIEKLQKYLTDTDVKVRSKCVSLIGEVIHQLPNSQLTEEEVELLVTYMCERLIDHHSVQPPALFALLALSGCTNFVDGLASRICRIIFQNVHNQSLSQGDRCNVYTIISNFLEKRMEELQKMEADFVLGFIQAMDTEKDPRNLVICFQCARTIILNFSLGNFVEEMFEVTSCYFPIDFTPPPNDAYKITRDDLIKGLRGCLSATEKFGEFAYPLLLEKLTSELPSAKLDSLQTLSECVEIYGIKHLREFQSSLYNCVKSEVFSSGSPTIEESGLEALKRIVRTLSKSSLEGDGSPVNVFVSEVLQDCKRYMTGEDTRLLVPVCRLLEASAQGSDPACCLVLQNVIPSLIHMYNNSSVNSQRKAVLDIISKFVQVVCGYPAGKCQEVLLTHIEELSTLIKGALSDSSSHLRLTGITGVNEMIIVNSGQVQVYTDLILDKFFTDEDKEVRNCCLKPLKTVAEISADVLEGTILPKVLGKFKEKLNNDEDADSSELVDALSVVTLGYKPFVTVSTELVQMVAGISSKGTSCQNLEQKTNSLIKCLLTIIQNNIDSQKSFTYMLSDLILQLYKIVIESSVYIDSVLQSPGVLHDVCRCVQCIACRCNKSELKELYSITTKIFLNGDLTDLCTKVDKFYPFDILSPWQQTQLVSMTTPAVCCCNEQLPDEEEYVQKLLALCQHCSHIPTQISASKCLAGIVNKHPHVLEVVSIAELQKTVQCPASNSRRQVLQLLIWLTKALVLRGHSDGQSLVMLMMTLLSDLDIGTEVADGFDMILTDSEDVLTKSMNAVIRIMYKQRLFVENVSNLVKSFESADKETRKNYLKVLSSMLKTLPKQVLLTELPPLFPLMIHSLMSYDLDLQISTMETIYDLTHDAPDVVSSHIDSLVPQLLKLSGNQSSMKLRQSALQCLGVLTVLQTHIILPYKGQVIRGLERALDDKKRLVRKEAVTARNEWFLLGTSSK